MPILVSSNTLAMVQYDILTDHGRYFVQLYPHCLILTDDLLCELRDIVLFLIGGMYVLLNLVIHVMSAEFLHRPHDITVFDSSLHIGCFAPDFGVG